MKQFFLGYLADTNASASQATVTYNVSNDTVRNIYYATYFKNNSAGTNGAIVKYNSSGDLQWQRSIAGPNSASAQSDFTFATVTDSSSNVYILGSFKNASAGRNAYLIKYNSSGTLQWQRTLSGTPAAASQSDNPYNMGIDSSANIYFSMYSSNSSGGTDGIIAKYNSSGALQWQRSITNPSISASAQGMIPWGLTVDSSGNSYIGGYYRVTSGGNNILVLKYDSSGNLSWQRNVASGLNNDNNRGMSIDSSGNSYISAYYVNASGGLSGWVAKYNSSGTLQWQRILTSANSAATQFDVPNQTATDSSGNVYVALWSRNSSVGNYGGLVKYNSSGTLQWQRTFTDSNAAASQGTALNGVYVDNDGNVNASGYTKNTNGGTNAFVIKVPADGSRTGTYTIDATHTITYAAASYTDTAASFTDTAGILVSATSSLTDAAGSLTDAAGSLTNAKVNI
jgi:hypothetical protein